MHPTITLITDDWLKQHKPCQEAIDWWAQKEQDPIKILNNLIAEKRYDWANWFIVRVMEYQDYVAYGVFAAEQVLPIFEEAYPDDKRPRKAIEVAKRCIKNPSEKNKEAARAAWVAAEAAAEAARAAWAAAGAAAGAAMQLKILQYGMKLLTEERS